MRLKQVKTNCCRCVSVIKHSKNVLGDAGYIHVHVHMHAHVHTHTRGVQRVDA